MLVEMPDYQPYGYRHFFHSYIYPLRNPFDTHQLRRLMLVGVVKEKLTGTSCDHIDNQVVVQLPQTPEDDLRSARAVRGRRTW